jgi:hypothetical protein
MKISKKKKKKTHLNSARVHFYVFINFIEVYSIIYIMEFILIGYALQGALFFQAESSDFSGTFFNELTNFSLKVEAVSSGSGL